MTKNALHVSMLLVIMSAGVCGISVFGQATAQLTGSVTDPSGAVVVGAHIAVTNIDTGLGRSSVSNESGYYTVPLLPPGNYQVTVTKEGFKPITQSGVTLQVNQVARLDFVVQIGPVTETLEVSGAAPLLQASASAIGQVVDNQSIANLPLNQRNPYTLALLVPGVTGTTGLLFNSTALSVNGSRPGLNEMLVDGAPTTASQVNYGVGVTVFPSVDGVQEFKVQTNNYSAEFGRTAGAVINLVFKSGTNRLHGSAFDFLRNSLLDSNNFFANRSGQLLASYKRNQFGGSLGGPVYLPGLYNGHNKTFFFVDYEGLRERAAANLLTTVPTALERSGDFSQTHNAAGSLVTIYDPATTTPSGSGFIRQAFAGNIIPSARIDPVAARAVRFYPLPNLAGDPRSGINNYAASAAAPTNTNTFDVKADENINDRNRFFARFSHHNLVMPGYSFFPEEDRPADGANNTAAGGSSQQQRSSNAAIDYTRNVRPTYLIELRYSFGRMAYPQWNRSLGFDPTQLGLPAYFHDADILAFPLFSPAGYASLGLSSGRYRKGFEGHTLSLANTNVLTRHVLKYGFEARMMRVNDLEAQNADGNFSFNAAMTQGPNPNAASSVAGNGMASFLVGLGSGSLTRTWKVASSQSFYYGWYIADDWRVTSRLTLNVGLRYELDVPRTERYNRMNVFDPLVPSPLAGPAGLPNLTGGLEWVALDGRSRQQFEARKDQFAPRLGFAYQARKDLVLRGGGGVFYAPSTAMALGSVGNIGYRTDTTYVGSSDGVTPQNYIRNPFPDGLLPIVGNSRGVLTGVGAAIQGFVRGDDVHPYSLNWNFNIEKQLPGSILVEAAYVGARGLHLNQSMEGDTNLNQLTPAQLALGSSLQQQVKNPFYGLITSGPLSSATVARSYLVAPFPQFTTVGPLWKEGASSIYHALQLKAEKRFGSGLSFLLSYTAGKLIDVYSISAQGRNAPVQNIYDLNGQRSVSPLDVSQNLVISFVGELPFGKKKPIGKQWNRLVDTVLGGWQANGTATLQTGQPLVLSTQNTSGSGSAVLYPNNNGKSAKLDGSIHSRLNRYFNTSVFSQPAPFTFGNTGRTLPDVRGPGVDNIDFSLFKNFRCTERARLQVRAEAFNLFNSPQFGFPGQALNATAFGIISAQANSPRQVQLGLKVIF
jgi:hypothetical protein